MSLVEALAGLGFAEGGDESFGLYRFLIFALFLTIDTIPRVGVSAGKIFATVLLHL